IDLEQLLVIGIVNGHFVESEIFELIDRTLRPCSEGAHREKKNQAESREGAPREDAFHGILSCLRSWRPCPVGSLPRTLGGYKRRIFTPQCARQQQRDGSASPPSCLRHSQ